MLIIPSSPNYQSHKFDAQYSHLHNGRRTAHTFDCLSTFPLPSLRFSCSRCPYHLTNYQQPNPQTCRHCWSGKLPYHLLHCLWTLLRWQSHLYWFKFPIHVFSRPFVPQNNPFEHSLHSWFSFFLWLPFALRSKLSNLPWTGGNFPIPFSPFPHSFPSSFLRILLLPSCFYPPSSQTSSQASFHSVSFFPLSSVKFKFIFYFVTVFHGFLPFFHHTLRYSSYSFVQCRKVSVIAT